MVQIIGPSSTASSSRAPYEIYNALPPGEAQGGREASSDRRGRAAPRENRVRAVAMKPTDGCSAA